MNAVASALLCLGLLLSPVTAAAGERLTLAHLYQTSTAHHRWIVWAAAEIARLSDGRYSLDVLAQGEIGLDESQLKEAVLLGALDMAYLGIGYSGTIHPPLAVGGAPYVFRDYDHWKAFRDGALFDELRQGFAQSSGGARILGLTYYGQRHVSAKRPIASLADIRNLVIRVPAQPPFTHLFRTLGAKPVTMPFLGVYDALREGLVEAQENPLPTIKAMRFHEVSGHIALTGHILDCLVTVVSGKRWDNLAAADKAMFEAVFRAAASRASDEVQREEAELIDALRRQGVAVREIDTEPFRQLVRSKAGQGGTPWDATLYDRIQNLP